MAEVQTAVGKIYLYAEIERMFRFAVSQLVERDITRTALDFLEAVVGAVFYAIHTVLNENGIHFADILKNQNGSTARFRGHPFERACWRHGIICLIRQILLVEYSTILLQLLGWFV